jgi:hypothetical protein
MKSKLLLELKKWKRTIADFFRQDELILERLARNHDVWCTARSLVALSDGRIKMKGIHERLGFLASEGYIKAMPVYETSGKPVIAYKIRDDVLIMRVVK